MVDDGWWTDYRLHDHMVYWGGAAFARPCCGTMYAGAGCAVGILVCTGCAI